MQGQGSGSRTESGSLGGLPANSTQEIVLFQVTSGGPVVGSLTTVWPGTPYTWSAAVSGTISGSTMSLTWTITPGSVNLPAGNTACGETESVSLSTSGTTTTATVPSYHPCGSGATTVNSYALTINGWQAIKQCATPNQGPCIGGGEPIDMAIGNVYDSVTDYQTAGPNKLSFTRYYSSFVPNLTYATSMANNWRTQYDRYLQLISSSQVVAEREDGQLLTFNLVSGVWTPATDVDMTLTNSGSTWTLTDHYDNVETYTASTSVAYLNSIKARNGYTLTLAYNGSNQLTTVTDSYSRQLGLTYTSGLLTQVTTPDSLVLTYGYNTGGTLLTSVSYNTSPATNQTYNYTNSSFPNALTSVTDEDSNTYLSWTYDSYGRGLTSQIGTGTNAKITTVTYNDSAGTRTLKNPLGLQDTYTIAALQSSNKAVQIVRTANGTVLGSTRSFLYDSNGYLASAKDWNGNTTTYVNDAHGDPTTIVEASGTTIARTTTIAYDPTFVHLPDTITTAGLTTGYTYDTNGNPLTKTLTDTSTQTIPYSTNGQTRTWNYTWSNFLPLTAKTPNGNTTTYTFDTTGALTNIQNALLQNTQISSHTGGGRPLVIVDPNSVTTTLTYSPRNWPLTSAVTTTGGVLTTTNTYDAAGNLTEVQKPDGSFLANTYDTAHRLTKVADSFGNSINYTLDALGDATATKYENPSSTVTRSTSATFDALGRKTKYTGGVTQNTLYGYDKNSNLTSLTNPINGQYTYTIDALNRWTREQVSSFGNINKTYDAHDRPLTVEDQTSKTTSYVYDGFGDAIQQASPDTGTAVYHYDTDANLTQKVDALSVTTNYTWDTLDRMLTTAYPASTSENVAYTYDQTGTGFAFGIGRLTSLTDAAGSLSRTYDERGNLITDKRVIGTSTLSTTYGYDAASRILSITYPDSAVLTYTRDAMGRITGASATPSGGSATTVASSIAYAPFGPWTTLTNGNSVVETPTIDADYRVTKLVDAGTATVQNITYTLNLADQPTLYTDSLTSSNTIQSIGYDATLRMTQFLPSGLTTRSMPYDDNANRTSYTGSATSYTLNSGTNQLATIVNGASTTTVTTNANGNITGFSPGFGAAAVTTLNYNNANRLSSVASSAGTLGTYLYDAFGHRLSKIAGTTTTLYQYDFSDTLLAEINGSVETDYLYINPDLGASTGLRPLAMLTGTTYTWLHDDHLGRPQVATNASQTVIWKSSYLPFGEVNATSGTATVNLRFPGQYYDAESGFNYNGMRDYVPVLGRYLEADPIGIEGGMNVYGYVGQNPMRDIDPTGKDTGELTDTPQQTPIPTDSNGQGQCQSSLESNCLALKNSILNTCIRLTPMKRMACYQAAVDTYDECMGGRS